MTPDAPVTSQPAPTKMADPSFQVTEDEVVQLNYIQNSDLFQRQKPYEVISEVPQGLDKSNFDVKPGVPETIHDLRGQETHFNLDDNGFQVVQHPLQTTVFDKETITTQYLPAIESLLKTIEPGIEVHIFDWTLRASDLPSPKPGSSMDLNDPMLCLKPVQAVHVDQSPYAAKKRAINAHGDDPSAVEGKRIRIIKSDLTLATIGAPIANRRSVWRPITHPIENYPLALCDGSTVPPEMLLRVDHVRKYYVGESLYPLQSPKYRWHYLNRQTRDEVLLFKMYDSRESVAAKCCPHTSFEKPKASPSCKPRESIEVSALVLSPE